MFHCGATVSSQTKEIERSLGPDNCLSVVFYVSFLGGARFQKSSQQILQNSVVFLHLSGRR